MNDRPSLIRYADPESQLQLVQLLESASRVRKSSHFFAWTQGPLHAILPHEILICGMPEGPDRQFRLRYFTATRYFKRHQFDIATHPRSGVISQAIQHWKGVQKPCLIPAPPGLVNCPAEWHDMLQRLELKNMAAHGMFDSFGGLHAWFGFFRVGEGGEHVAGLLELMLPTIAAAYARMLVYDGPGLDEGASLGHVLTRREIQVLELLRDGCANHEIAAALEVSVLTAKNHVQNIRGKLRVRTRGQAVSEGLRLGLIRPRMEHGNARVGAEALEPVTA